MTKIAPPQPNYFFPSKLSEGSRVRLGEAVEQSKGLDFERRAAEFKELSSRFRAEAQVADAEYNLGLAVSYSILSDLIGQGWTVDANEYGITVEAVSFEPLATETIDHAKRRIRAGLQIASNQQLAEPSVRAFIAGMERVRDFNGKKVSILSLIDNGQSLAAELEKVGVHNTGVARKKSVSRLIKPVLQECGTDERCSETGMKLQDIWRYFRYTWSLAYNPLPGRTQRFLLRNAARPGKPIIGIAMFASPTANLGSRDKWIGWHLDALAQKLSDGEYSADAVARRLIGALDDAVGDIRHDDLLDASEIVSPNLQTLVRLEQHAAQAHAQRREDLTDSNGELPIDIRGFDKDLLADEGWRVLSDTGLFRKKRAEQLVPLLRSIQTLNDAGIRMQPATALYLSFTRTAGQSAIRVALNEIKKKHLATEIADLAVCGAIAPYNLLLGGKLVALSMVSKEARQMYGARYSGQVSEIASQVAGRAVVRSSDLKLVTTTSLYGLGSNQYTGLSLRKGKYGDLSADVVWKKLQSGSGVSITHVSDRTVFLMRELGLAVYGRRRINSVFGEGSSPRMRQIREGLNLIGINDDTLLKQSHGRRVYGCELFDGAREDILGFGAKAKRRVSASLAQISSAWIERWLLPRLEKADFLDDLKTARPESIVTELLLRAMKGDVCRQSSLRGDVALQSTDSISDSSDIRSKLESSVSAAATTSKT
jgi:hypothetical protein